MIQAIQNPMKLASFCDEEIVSHTTFKKKLRVVNPSRPLARK